MLPRLKLTACSIILALAPALSANQPLDLPGDLLPPEGPDQFSGTPVLNDEVAALCREYALAFWRAYDNGTSEFTVDEPAALLTPYDFPHGYQLFDQDAVVFSRLFASRIGTAPGQFPTLNALINGDTTARDLLRLYMTTHTIETDPAIHGAEVHADHVTMILEASSTGPWVFGSTGSGQIETWRAISNGLLTPMEFYFMPKRAILVSTPEEIAANMNPPPICIQAVAKTKTPFNDLQGNPVPVGSVSHQVLVWIECLNWPRVPCDPPEWRMDFTQEGFSQMGNVLVETFEIPPPFPVVPQGTGCGPTGTPPPNCQKCTGEYRITYSFQTLTRIQGIQNFEIKPVGIGTTLPIGWNGAKILKRFECGRGCGSGN
jgi:hypothetical protein